MKRLLSGLAIAAAFWMAACGGGGFTITPPPPVGNFSNASLNGQYAFVTNGEVFAGATVNPLARVGSFVADGKGGITAGVEDTDLGTNAGATPSGALAISGGSYTVGADGRGTLTLTLGQSSINFGIVLNSINNGLMIDETSNSSQSSTGSGNFIKQQSTPFVLTDIAGLYVFDFSGFDANNNSESFLGEFTANNGVISTGFFDDNVNGALSNGNMAPGTLAKDPLQLSAFDSFGRGLALIAGQTFVFYIVDSNHVRFISTNKGMLSGDAVAQANNVPTTVSSLNGGFVFVVGGSSPSGGLTRVGRFTVTGGNVSNILMDINDAGAERQAAPLTNASINLDAVNPGRGTLSFQDSSLTYSFVFYLSSQNSGVFQDVSPSSTAGIARDTADGSIELQSGSPFTTANITGTYALNWSGLVVAGGAFPIEDEEDLLAQLKVSSLSLSGTADIFQFTSSTLTPVANLGTGGQITIPGDGTGNDGQRVDMTVNLSNNSPIHMVVYIVNPQFAFFANRDNNGTQRIVVGVLKAQQ